jgi:hypothetical protein
MRKGYNIYETIKYILANGFENQGIEKEVIPRDSHIFGSSVNGKYVLTYDIHTGAFDVWETV